MGLLGNHPPEHVCYRLSHGPAVVVGVGLQAINDARSDLGPGLFNALNCST